VGDCKGLGKPYDPQTAHPPAARQALCASSTHDPIDRDGFGRDVGRPRRNRRERSQSGRDADDHSHDDRDLHHDDYDATDHDDHEPLAWIDVDDGSNNHADHGVRGAYHRPGDDDNGVHVHAVWSGHLLLGWR